MAVLKQSTSFTRTFLMVDGSDHLSPKTGLTVGVWLSKAGAAFTAVSGTVSEISFGWYKVALNATDTNTLGDLAFHCTGTSADLTDFVDQVTANILGDTLPANVTQWLAVAPNALISGTVDAFAHYINPVAVADKTGFSLATPQSFDLIGNVTGTLTNVLNVVNPVIAGVVTGSVLGNVNGSVASVTNPIGINTGTFIDAIADGVWDEQLAGHLVANSAGYTLASRMPTGTVLVGDKTGFSLSSPQNFNLIGNISGTFVGNIQGSVGSVTGTTNANVLQWVGQSVPTPNVTGVPKVDVTNWLSGSVSNPNVVGVPKVDLVDIDGLATNGNNATLKLKMLDIQNLDNYGEALLLIGGPGGAGASIEGGGSTDDAIQGGAGIIIDGGYGNTGTATAGWGVSISSGVDNGAGGNHALIIGGTGKGVSIKASQGIIGDITGSITGNLLGYAGWVTGSVQSVLQPVGINTGSFINAVADQVWDETLAGHLLVGSTGEKLNAAASAGDPWTTALPGLYTVGQAGHILASRMPTGTGIPTATENADELLRRDWNSVTGTSSRSVHNALRKLRNKVSFDGVSTLTVTKEDDTTSAYTQGITTDENQEPFKSVG